jgi:hypothetical protein
MQVKLLKDCLHKLSGTVEALANATVWAGFASCVHRWFECMGWNFDGHCCLLNKWESVGPDEPSKPL